MALDKLQCCLITHGQEHRAEGIGLGAGRRDDRRREQARGAAVSRARIDRVGDLVALLVEVVAAVVARSGHCALVESDAAFDVVAIGHIAVKGRLYADAPRCALAVMPLAAHLATDIDDVVLSTRSLEVVGQQIDRVALGYRV